jgi:formate--tetrahydrofolate ligase
LKLHGGAPEKDIKSGTIEHLRAGLPNLEKHVENMRRFGIPAVVALNLFAGDTAEEIEVVTEFCRQKDTNCLEVRAFEAGAKGAIELANSVVRIIDGQPSAQKPIYELSDPVEKKIEKVATEIYGAKQVVFAAKAEKDLVRIDQLGLSNLPVCIAKTNRSLSDDPARYGRPRDFKITITDINISAGAGFLVPLAGEIMLMPGLARMPNALKIDIDETGRISGLS